MSKLVVRGAMVVVVLLLIGLLVFRDRFTGSDWREGWSDCSSPAAQELPPTTDGEPISLDVVQVASVSQPTSIEDTESGMLVSSLTGTITNAETDDVVLDLSDEVLVGAEQGLLDLELDPAAEWLYVSYTDQPDGTSRIRAWPWTGETLMPEAGTDIVTLEQPHRWHNGGGIRFGPDGHLYISFGDGGSDDVAGSERARELSSWYGSILRVDPTPDAGGFDVPDDNPFLGESDVAPEIFHSGLRNPWRFSFDRDDRLWIADVGHWCYEEINVVPLADAGLDFGWPGLEGVHEWAYPDDDDAQPPIYEYPHVLADEQSTGCAVAGGEVYEGEAIPELQGAYVFADVCDGGIRAIRYDGESVVEHEVDLSVDAPVAVMSDDDDRLYAMSLEDDGGVFELVAG